MPEFSDEVVRRIESAGMISLGKTNAPEFGSPCYTEPDVAPPARTPYDLTRSAGGSSGGAAAAVSGGLLPMAHGSDGGGSIRIPASVTGLVGFKPSRGRDQLGAAVRRRDRAVDVRAVASTVRDSAALPRRDGRADTDRRDLGGGSAGGLDLPRLVRPGAGAACRSRGSVTR